MFYDVIFGSGNIMADTDKSVRSFNLSTANQRQDISQSAVINAAVGNDAVFVGRLHQSSNIRIDGEVANLLEWLATQQGISPDIALKKAVVTAAYIQDITAGQGGTLLIKRSDNSVGEIVL